MAKNDIRCDLMQVIHQVMKEATESSKKEEEPPSLAEQLAAAKSDPQRISQAVESIGSYSLVSCEK